MIRMKTRIVILVTFFAVLVSATALAQAPRTWVSGNGDDTFPCSYTAPCKTFSGAYSKTATGGVISVQDPGPYGAVTISKSITLDGGGTYASILHTTDAIIVNFTGAADSFGNTVILRGLSFDSPNSSSFGVNVLGSGVAHLHIENCTFARAQAAVSMAPGGAGSSLDMTNVVIRKMNAYGVIVDPPAGTPLKLSLDHVRIHQSAAYGLVLMDNTNGTISDSNFSNNGIGASIHANNVFVNFVRTVLSGNSSTGLYHVVAGIQTLIDGCSIFSNGVGISNTGGTVIGFTNNSIANNGNDVVGNPVQSLLQK
jgi:hypothetical protein